MILWCIFSIVARALSSYWGKGVSENSNNSSNFVNTGTIPAGLIDRIEVATSGSSAIYGSDAVTGVVNIITTTGLVYSEVDAFVGQTDNGGDNILDLTFTNASNFWEGTFFEKKFKSLR